MTELSSNAVDTVAQLARDACKPMLFNTEDGRQFALLTDRHGQQRLEDITGPGHAPALPPFVKASVVLTEQVSFVDYVEAFKTTETRLFASLNQSSGGGDITAEIDYHDPANAGRRAHRATFRLTDSEEWRRWSEASGKLRPQREFVRFLEENAADIEKPAGADILEMARDFSAARKVNFASAVRLDNGDTSFEYVAEAEARSKAGQITVPTMFELKIPVFQGEPHMTVRAFLRWDIVDGALKMGIELHRPLQVRLALFRQIAERVQQALATPLHYGSAGS